MFSYIYIYGGGVAPCLGGVGQPKLGLGRGRGGHGDVARPHHRIDPQARHDDRQVSLSCAHERIQQLDLALVVEVDVEAEVESLGQVGGGFHRGVVHNQAWLES